MREDEYTPEERRLFETLPRESAPDPLDEERIIGRLRAEGLVEPVASAFTRKLLFRRKALMAAAAVFLLACGVLIGSVIPRSPVTGSACGELPGAVPSSVDPSRKEPVRTAGVLWF